MVGGLGRCSGDAHNCHEGGQSRRAKGEDSRVHGPYPWQLSQRLSGRLAQVYTSWEDNSASAAHGVQTLRIGSLILTP
eukprot:1085631-Pleurochrysis_carterae.AAC.1